MSETIESGVRYADKRLIEIQVANGTLTEDQVEILRRRHIQLSRPRVIGEPIIRPPPRYKYAKDATHKPCNRCKENKPLEAYRLLPSGALGRNPKCTDCLLIIARSYTKRTRELKATRPRPDRCEVCNDKADKRALHWDHDHRTGKFRGWLCSPCNNALGNVKDSPDRLAKLIRYLVRQSLQPDDLLHEKLIKSA